MRVVSDIRHHFQFTLTEASSERVAVSVARQKTLRHYQRRRSASGSEGDRLIEGERERHKVAHFLQSHLLQIVYKCGSWCELEYHLISIFCLSHSHNWLHTRKASEKERRTRCDMLRERAEDAKCVRLMREKENER